MSMSMSMAYVHVRVDFGIYEIRLVYGSAAIRSILI